MLSTLSPYLKIGPVDSEITGLKDIVKNKLSPRERRDDMPLPMAVRLAADLRPSANGSTIRTSLVAGQLQAASVPIA